MNTYSEPKPNSGPLDRYNSIGIILAGGGAKGAYQAGALKAIHDFLSRHKAHDKVRMIAGTSIGSWNAMFWLAGLVEENNSRECELERWWSSLSLPNLVRPVFYLPGFQNYFATWKPWSRNFNRIFTSDESVAARLRRHIEQPDSPGSIHFYLTRSNVERALLEVTTNQRELETSRSNLPTRKWRAGTRRVDCQIAKSLEDLHTAVFSSMDLPPLFKYSQIGDQYYEDGGVVDNLPIQFGTEIEKCDLLFILPLNATFSRSVNHRSIIKRLLRVMDVRQGVLERNSFKMVYLYNELAALRHRTEEFESLADRALTILKGRAEPEIQPLIEELLRMRPEGTGAKAEDALLADRALMRRHRRVDVFAICPAPKLAVNTIDFWKRDEAGRAFRLMRDVTSGELEKFFAAPPEWVRMALVQPSRDVVYLEEF